MPAIHALDYSYAGAEFAALVLYWYFHPMTSPLTHEYQRLAAADTTRTLAYARLRQAVQNLIDRGVLQPGQALPSERDLCQQLSLSRVTVRRALAGLVEAGLLTQRHGAGSFVAERIQRSFSRLTSFTDDLRERGLNPRSEFFERSVGEVTPDEAMALNLSPGSGVVRIHRVRFGGDSPLAVERTLVPHALLPDPQAVVDSLYEALQPYGNRPVRALQHLRAVALDAETSRLLHLPAGSPGLLIERRAFLADGRVVESTRSFYRGDAYDFVAELHSD
jgi:GntR family transcriptional regulator